MAEDRIEPIERLRNAGHEGDVDFPMPVRCLPRVWGSSRNGVTRWVIDGMTAICGVPCNRMIAAQRAGRRPAARLARDGRVRGTGPDRPSGGRRLRGGAAEQPPPVAAPDTGG